VSVFWVLLGIAVLGGVAVVAAGRGDGLADAERDRADLTLPQDRPAAREDVDRLRFTVGLRGYRMDEVDDVLDRLALDIAIRDGQISELRSELGDRHGPVGGDADRDHGPDQQDAAVEGAALVVPADVPLDPATSRTLVVPLEPYDRLTGADSEPDEPGPRSPGADQRATDRLVPGLPGPAGTAREPGGQGPGEPGEAGA